MHCTTLIAIRLQIHFGFLVMHAALKDGKIQAEEFIAFWVSQCSAVETQEASGKVSMCFVLLLWAAK